MYKFRISTSRPRKNDHCFNLPLFQNAPVSPTALYIFREVCLQDSKRAALLMEPFPYKHIPGGRREGSRPHHQFHSCHSEAFQPLTLFDIGGGGGGGA